MIYTVTLNPALDYILRLSRLSSEDVNRADSAQLLCGGKGINVSMVLSGLGVPTRALGFVAGFTGRALEQMLQAQGIQTDFVPLAAGNTRINVKIFADRQTDINAPGAQPAEAEVEALFHKLEGLMPGDFLVLAGAVLAVLVVLGGGGAFAYIKFIRPKQASKVSADPDDYDFADEEEYINEDEPAEAETEAEHE